MTDPVAEVEVYVELVIREHMALWGCDDPACAIANCTMRSLEDELLLPARKRSWWQLLLRR